MGCSGWGKRPQLWLAMVKRKTPTSGETWSGPWAVGGQTGVTPKSSTYWARLQPRMAASLAAKVLSPIEALLFVMSE